jgi:large subunit ribosomal protein L6
MSRIGKLPVPISDKVEFSINADNIATFKGEKGTNTLRIHPDISIEKSENKLIVKRANDEKEHRALHGLFRSLINNAVIGVSEGYTKKIRNYWCRFSGIHEW